MRVYLKEITDQGKEFDFTGEDAWAVAAVATGDEADTRKFRATPRPLSMHLSVRKVDTVVLASGKISSQVRLLCSRCGENFDHDVRGSFSALYCQDPALAGVAHLQEGGMDAGKPTGRTFGYARHAHDAPDEAGAERGESNQDIDITYLTDDFIELGDLITEQVQLQIPFQPLCAEACRGVCLHCGTNLNKGRCACAKLQKETPFSVLRDFKL